MSSKVWDNRFLAMALTVSQWSKDPDHQVGAVIVDKLNRVISVGYNGPPRGVVDIGLEEKTKVLRSIHAELNAVLNSNIGIEGCTLYVYPFSPCAQCAAAIIQKGISRIVYKTDTQLRTWKASQMEAFRMLDEVGILIDKL